MSARPRGSLVSPPQPDPALARAWEENVKLRYLCLVLIPELSPSAKWVPGERPIDRLNYLLGHVDGRAAAQKVQEAGQLSQIR